MSSGRNPFTKLKELLNFDNNTKKKRTTYLYLIGIILLGGFIMSFSNLSKEKVQVASTEPTGETEVIDEDEDLAAFSQKGLDKNDLITAYEQTYEKRIKEALENIVGVDDVTVVVNVDATDKKILEKNTTTQTQLTKETDREGGKREIDDHSKEEQVVIVKKGNEEIPIVLETKKPHIRGVLVVAQGAENINVKKWIVEAVTRGLDVPSHRVAVMPKKSKGE